MSPMTPSQSVSRRDVVRGAAGLGMMAPIAFGVPAVARAQEATPVNADVQREVLFSATIPAEHMPSDIITINFNQISVNAESELAYDEGYSPPHSLIEYVESGELLIRPLAETLVWRSGSSKRTVPERMVTGQDIALVAGDTFLTPQLSVAEHGSQAIGYIANPGSEPNSLLGVWLRVEGHDTTSLPSGLSVKWTISNQTRELLDELAGRETEFRLSRATVGPGQQIAFPNGALFASYQVRSGGLDWRVTPEGKESTALHWFEGSGNSIYPFGGTKQEVINMGEVPAVILELAVIPTALPPAQEATPAVGVTLVATI